MVQVACYHRKTQLAAQVACHHNLLLQNVDVLFLGVQLEEVQDRVWLVPPELAVLYIAELKKGYCKF